MTITTLAGILFSGCSNQEQSAQPPTTGAGAMGNSSQEQTNLKLARYYAQKQEEFQKEHGAYVQIRGEMALIELLENPELEDLATSMSTVSDSGNILKEYNSKYGTHYKSMEELEQAMQDAHGR